MKKVNVTTVIAGVVLLAVGYLGGAYIGFPKADSEKLSGDMSQVDAESEDPDMVAMQELLQKDPEAQRKSIVSTAILSSRIDVIDSIADAGVKATANQKGLSDVNKYFVSLKRKADKAKANFEALLATNEKVIKGEKVKDFESVSNKALLSFIVLDNALSNDAVGDLLDYTREIGNDNASNAVASWIAFCQDNAEMKGNPNDIAMWEKVYTTLGDAVKKNYAQSKQQISSNISNNLAAKLDESSKDLKNVDMTAVINNVKSQGANGKDVINLGKNSSDKLSDLAALSCNQR